MVFDRLRLAARNLQLAARTAARCLLMAATPAKRMVRWLIVTALIFVIATIAIGFFLGQWLVPIIVSLLALLAELVFFLLRNLISAEREERLERGSNDAGAAGPAPGAELPASFRRSLTELRGSRLGRDGLYALPWYLVIGPPGSGKSAALGASGLDLPAEFAHVAHGGATRDCDWWLTNEAIVLDTAGRLSVSDSGPERDEWLTLLRLLRKTRPNRAANGVIVVLSAVRLVTASGAQLEAEARTLRRRLNEIVDTLAVDPPVYVVVSQLDRIEGFVELASALPPNRLVEALGFTNGERRFADAGDLAARALEAIRDRLETLVDELVLREPDPARRRRVLCFPHEFEALADAIAVLLRSAFAPSVYEETPFLRGVYFASARRGGGTSSAVLSRLGQDWARAQHANSAPQGWFLRDLFRDVVIGDRDLAIPHNALGPRARRAVFAVAAAVCAAAISAWAIAAWRVFTHENDLVDRARRVVEAPSSLETIGELRRAIASADDVTVLGRLGLGAPLDRARRGAREVFVWAFGTYFEQDAKSQLRNEGRSLEPSAFEALAELSLDLNWLQTRGAVGDAQRPHLVRYARRIGRNETDQLVFTESYDDFVRWLPDPEIARRLEDERRSLATASSTVLSIQYLERWSEQHLDTRPAVRYADFGLSAGDGTRDAVSSAYTKQTWEGAVRGLVAGVAETKGLSEASIKSFTRSYTAAYDAAWERFLLNVPVRAAAGGPVKQTPYPALLRRVADEMKAELPRDGAPRPAWVAVLDEVLREDAPPAKEGDKGPPPPAPPWSRYQVAIEAVAKDVEIAQLAPSDALKIAVDLAGPNPSSFQRAFDEIRSIIPAGDPAVRGKLVEILEAPVYNGLETVLAGAAQQLDQEWRNAVAIPFANQLDEARMQELYGTGGALSQFHDAWLAPFLRGGVPRALVRDRQMPFGPRFLAWLGEADRMGRKLQPGSADAITVRIEGIPSHVVTGNVVESKRVLQVDCPDQVYTLEYRPNRPHTISWTTGCTEVKLRVSVLEKGAERELPAKSWHGPLALPTFFRSAERSGDDFVWKVEDQGVELSVPYRMRAGQAILDVSHRNPPDSIRE
jgi:type VI protein secretion system component VasK